MSASDPSYIFTTRVRRQYIYIFPQDLRSMRGARRLNSRRRASTVLRLDFEEYQNLGGNDETTLFCESSCGLGGGHSCCNTRRRCS